MRAAYQQALVMGLCAAAAAVFMLWLVPGAIIEPRSVSQPGLSPRFLPNILGVSILILSAIGLVRALVLARLDSAGDANIPSITSALGEQTLPIVSLVVLVASVLSIGFLGMMGAAIAASLVLLVLGGERRLWALALVGIGLPVAISQFFILALHVPLPAAPFMR